jgi:dTMP kinase
MSARGKFITFEGIDGAGKSSHLDLVCELVRARGHGVERTFEPGGTPFGQRLREVVLSEPASAFAQALAMFSARRAHLEAVIEPALAAGRWVVCDRFSDSTYAYQCGGGGLESRVVEQLEALVHPGMQPDATFLFDINPGTAHRRQVSEGRRPDEFERREGDFHARVRDAYRERARQFPGRFHVIDASGTREEVARRLEAAFARAFP